MDLAYSALIVLVACSSSSEQVRHAEDARKPMATEDAAAARAVDAAPVAAIKPPTTGDVSVRVEWRKLPRAAFVSPGLSACGTPLTAQVSPSTTWGIADVVVFVADAPTPPPAEARVVAARCTIEPHLAIGTRAMIASSADRPLELSLVRKLSADDLQASDQKPIAIALPIAGHEVTAALEAGAIYRVAGATKTDDAWIVAAPAALTDASGTAVIKDLPPGTHRVRVWLPPRGGQVARTASAEVTVEAGDLAELTLELH